MDVLIDLDAAPPPAATHRHRRPLLRLNPRLLLVVGLALTLVIPAGAGPRPAPLRRLLTIAAPGSAAYLLRDNVLYVGDDSTVAAYQLLGGRLRWRTSVDLPVQSLTAVAPAGVVVALLGGSAPITLASFDLATGAALWLRANLAGRPVPGTGKLLAIDYGGTGVGQAGAGQRMELLDARTGRPDWERAAPETGALIPGIRAPGQPGPIRAVARSGFLDVEVFDVASGATISSGSLSPRVPALAEPLRDYTVNLVGRVLLVAAIAADPIPAEPPPGDVEATAYGFDADTLAPLWNTPLGTSALYATDCATVICLYGEGGTVTLDPATGRLLGFADWRDISALGAGRLLADGDTQAVVGVDLVSQLDLTRWRAVGSGALTVVTRPGGPGGGTWVGTLDPAAPAVRVFGSVPLRTVDTATTDGRFLVCHVPRLGLTAFALR